MKSRKKEGVIYFPETTLFYSYIYICQLWDTCYRNTNKPDVNINYRGTQLYNNMLSHTKYSNP